MLAEEYDGCKGYAMASQWECMRDQTMAAGTDRHGGLIAFTVMEKDPTTEKMMSAAAHNGGWTGTSLVVISAPKGLRHNMPQKRIPQDWSNRIRILEMEA